MIAVTIDRVRARYRVPSGGERVGRRLDGMLERAFDSALEAGLELAGFGGAELVCVRRIEVPFQADLSRAEVGLAGAWAEAFARELRRGVDRGAADVVRYRSPSAALLDVLRRAPRDDFGRVWAWRSLGLWDGGEDPSPAAAAREAARTLRARPELAPSVLEALAEDGPARRLLFRRLDRSSWTKIAVAALRAAKADPGLVRAEDAAGVVLAGGEEERRDVASRPRPGPRAATVAARSALAEAGRRERVEPATARAVAILALLAGAPGAIARGRDVPAAVQAVARHILDRPPPGGSRDPSRRAADPGVGAENGRERPPVEPGPVRDGEGRSGVSAGEVEETERPGRDPGPGPGLEEGPGGDLDTGAEARDRVPARTEFAGLLFLLNLLDDDELRSGIVEAPALGERPLRWVLHRLATTLAPAPGEDPAVLAFCGVGPDAGPPCPRASLPAREEEEALDEGARRLRERLRERLELEDRSPGEVTREVVRREAVVVADPGWIEVRLPLRQVSPGIRRAGLDLDPGYLPWLGVVMRFAYV